MSEEKCEDGCTNDHKHAYDPKTEHASAEVAATNAVTELLDKATLEGYAQQTANLIAEGKPKLDGVKHVAATHYYDTDKGRIGTFTMCIRGLPVKMYLGLDHEISAMNEDFKVAAKDAGSMSRNPKERAARRKQLRKQKAIIR